jgi:hypothetical protein
MSGIKEPVFQLAMLGISSEEVPIHHTLLGEDCESLLQNCLDLVEHRFLGYWCARTNDTTII